MTDVVIFHIFFALNTNLNAIKDFSETKNCQNCKVQ